MIFLSEEFLHHFYIRKYQCNYVKYRLVPLVFSAPVFFPGLSDYLGALFLLSAHFFSISLIDANNKSRVVDGVRAKRANLLLNWGHWANPAQDVNPSE